MKTPLVSALVFVSVCAAVPIASAQALPKRPYRAIFGGATNDPSIRHTLDVTLSAAQGYDDNLLAGSGLTAVPSQSSGMFSELAPGVTYAWIGKTAQFNATAGSSIRYYQSQHGFLGSTHFGAIGFSAGSERTRFSINQSFSYSPSYFYGLYPQLTSSDIGYVVGAGSEYAVTTEPVLTYDTSVNVSHALTSRSSVSLLGDFQYSDLSRVPGGRDLRSYSAGGRYAHTVSRNASFHLGYVYREAQYHSGMNAANAHDIDVGIDYQRPLSLSRRTRLDFAFGSSIVNTPSLNSDNDVQYRAVGTVGLSHDMGRTWRARAAYNRGLEFVQGLNQAVFSDGINMSLNGFASRRVDVHVGAGMSIGNTGDIRSSLSRVRTYTTVARLRTAINQTWALFGEYALYDYTLGNAVPVTVGVPRSLNRNSVRVGLTAWLPLFRE